MFQNGQSVALRHDVPGVPPLLRGHFGRWMGRRRQAESGRFTAVNIIVGAWVGDNRSWIEAKDSWLQALPPHAEARMTYLEKTQCRHDPETASVWSAYQDAWDDLLLLIRNLRGKTAGEEDQRRIWLCHTDEDLIRAMKLEGHLTHEASLDLHRKWLHLLNTHMDVTLQYLLIQEER